MNLNNQEELVAAIARPEHAKQFLMDCRTRRRLRLECQPRLTRRQKWLNEVKRVPFACLK